MTDGNFYWAENPRWAELSQALQSVQLTAAEIPEVLSDVHTAMEAGAWSGGTSDDFVGELSAQDTKAVEAGQESEEAVRSAMEGVPEQVKRYYDAMIPE